jgi:hypothetical protein
MASSAAERRVIRDRAGVALAALASVVAAAAAALVGKGRLVLVNPGDTLIIGETAAAVAAAWGFWDKAVTALAVLIQEAAEVEVVAVVMALAVVPAVKVLRGTAALVVFTEAEVLLAVTPKYISGTI